ncbi:GlxA family transcriptional regulator [Streptomyces sp. RKAG293]|uniref:GlxA family transcriptional regulator n=1 Tax=Streptomyces sp. RKAG293 TaxID=2893403 RepID=UPI002033AAC3|nr:helix-turn-helix domain-containing protein [Streptomyces sp. RKAG293]MCM2423858.1 helix-turn-helix domain-containing protein [Streptomyces sp. RKAG293]
MPQPPHRVVVAFPGVELLDVTGPAEVFSVATRVAGPDRPGYAVRIATADGGPVARAGRVGSICAGAHLLAAAGLLDGRPATTHWLTAARPAAEHPRVAVDPDPIFIRSGNDSENSSGNGSGSVWTCAGVTSGMDMALAMVAEDQRQALALTTARMMVMYVKRSGGQSQFSVPLSVQASAGDRIDELRVWIAEHLAEDLSAETLAMRLHLSVRHFSRPFRRRAATTPAAYVESARLEAARRLLEESTRSLPDIAAVEEPSG